jgi:hypothetical protein
VFDLDLLLRRHPAGASHATTRKRASEQALALPFAAFRDQVLPFLDADVAELYLDPAAWRQIQSFVVERLLETA